MKPNIVPPKSPFKWAAIGVGTLFGIAHLGMVGHLINRPLFPNLPVGNYTSYTVEYGRDGYRIKYNSNDPKVMTKDRIVDKKNGFFGIGGKTNIIQQEQYTMDGATHLQGGGEGKSAKDIECIVADAGARSQGAMAGSSIVAGAVIPSVIGIPYIGWLAAGWATLLGQKIGSEVGSEVGSAFNDC